MRNPRVAFPLELAVVWALFAVVGVELAVTYARLDASELYNVSGSGLEGGASRLLVFVNYPVAIVAIAVLLLLVERLGRGARVVAVAGIVLSAAVFWPGVVDPGNLDARPVNAIAACGVGVALALTALVWRRFGCSRGLDRTAVPLRIAVAAVALVVAVPWIAAESGVSFEGVPILGTLYQTRRAAHGSGRRDSAPGRPPRPPPRHGRRAPGLDGAAPAPARSPRRVALARAASTAYLALMLCYGAALTPTTRGSSRS